MTGGRGPDSVIDAVGMEAHGSPTAKAIQALSGMLPDALQAKVMETAGIDRLAALHTAIDLVRRGGTISIVGVYGGAADPLPMLSLFDKQVQMRMGQANVRRWTDDILPLLVEDDDVLGVEDFATDHLSLEKHAQGLRLLPGQDQRHLQGGVPALSADWRDEPDEPCGDPTAAPRSRGPSNRGTSGGDVNAVAGRTERKSVLGHDRRAE